MRAKLWRCLALTASLTLFAGCGEDPLGNDDDGGGTKDKAEDHSSDGTGVSGGTKKDSTTGEKASSPAGAVTGKINEKPWTYVSGGATTYAYSGKTNVTVQLFATEVEDPCTYDVKRSWLNAGYVKFSKTSGPDTADNYASGTAYYYDEKADVDDSSYAGSDDIEVEITSQTPSAVTGTVNMVGDVHSQVAGSFSVKVCD